MTDDSPPTDGRDDPIRARRARVARWALIANRVGYLLLGVSVALFVIAVVIGFSPAMSTLVLITLFGSFALLAPSIIIGYGVRAAEREES